MIRSYLLILALAAWFCPCLAEAADTTAYRIISEPRSDGVATYLVDVVSGPAALAGEYPAAANGAASIPLPANMPTGTVVIYVTACGPVVHGARQCSYGREYSFPFPEAFPGPDGLRTISRP